MQVGCLLYLRQWFCVSCPGNQLLGGHEVNIWESKDGVNELEEAVLAVLPVEEPGSVEEEGEGGFALCVVLQEVLGEDLLDGVGILGVETTISHGAGSASEMSAMLLGSLLEISTSCFLKNSDPNIADIPDILQSLHGDFPHTRMRLSRTRLDTAAVGHAVLQGVRPGGGPCGHGGVIVKAVPKMKIF